MSKQLLSLASYTASILRISMRNIQGNNHSVSNLAAKNEFEPLLQLSYCISLTTICLQQLQVSADMRHEKTDL